MIPDITDSLLDAMIQSRKMALAGLSYWQQGRVTNLQIDPEMSEISAHVQGSERHPYSVLIYFDDDDFDFGATTECSCPIGVGCKIDRIAHGIPLANCSVNPKLAIGRRSSMKLLNSAVW